MRGGTQLNENMQLFEKLLKAAAINEYQQSYPTAKTCFARTHYPQDSDNVAEIDLLDMNAKTAYEVKLSQTGGYKGFEILENLPELRGFTCTMLDDKVYKTFLYKWGQKNSNH